MENSGKLLLSRREFAAWWGCYPSYINRQVDSGFLPMVGNKINAREAWKLLNRRARSYGHRARPWPEELEDLLDGGASA
jgi:hypothetical protein